MSVTLAKLPVSGGQTTADYVVVFSNLDIDVDVVHQYLQTKPKNKLV